MNTRSSVPTQTVEFSDALIQSTLRVWQPYYDFPLTSTDALEILRNVRRMGELLGGFDDE